MNERPQPLVDAFGSYRRNRKKKPSCPLLNRVRGGRGRGPARGPVARLLPCLLVLGCPPVAGGPSVAVLSAYVCHQIERPAHVRAVAGAGARGQVAGAMCVLWLVAHPWPVGRAVGRVPTWWPCWCWWAYLWGHVRAGCPWVCWLACLVACMLVRLPVVSWLKDAQIHPKTYARACHSAATSRAMCTIQAH